MAERTPETSQNEPAAEGAVALDMLRLLGQRPQYSQRQLAVELGVSLGRTHYVLKALLARGWVKTRNFRRSDNKLGYLYVLTPAGMKKRLQMARAFLADKEAEYESLHRQIAALRRELSAAENGSD